MKDPYATTAAEILAQSSTLGQLTDWFDSDKPRSSFQFGVALGKDAAAGNATDTVRGWIASGQCLMIVAGYLNGTVSAAGTLDAAWSDQLEDVSGSYPEYVAQLTLQSDFGDKGVRRLLKLITSGAIPPRYLRGLSIPPWITVLGEAEKSNILHAVLHYEETDPPGMINTGLALIAGWTDYGKAPLPARLVRPSMDLLGKTLSVRVDPGNWGVLLKLATDASLVDAADAAIKAITSVSPSRTSLEDTALELLIGMTKTDPKFVMERVGRRIIDRESRPFFTICRLPGLFEAIGLEVVRQWVNAHGDSYAKYIARHVGSPYLHEGSPVVPPLTEWLFTAFEGNDAVFREFCMGRHAGVVRSGNAKDHRATLEARLQPFVDHPLSRVRDWVKFELQSNDQDAKMDDYLDDVQERM